MDIESNHTILGLEVTPTYNGIGGTSYADGFDCFHDLWEWRTTPTNPPRTFRHAVPHTHNDDGTTTQDPDPLDKEGPRVEPPGPIYESTPDGGYKLAEEENRKREEEERQRRAALSKRARRFQVDSVDEEEADQADQDNEARDSRRRQQEEARESKHTEKEQRVKRFVEDSSAGLPDQTRLQTTGYYGKDELFGDTFEQQPRLGDLGVDSDDEVDFSGVNVSDRNVVRNYGEIDDDAYIQMADTGQFQTGEYRFDPDERVVATALSREYTQWQQRPRDIFERQLANAGVSEEEIFRISKWRQDALEALAELAEEAQGKLGADKVTDSEAYRRWQQLRKVNPNAELINDQNLEDFAQRQVDAARERGKVGDALKGFRQEELQEEIDRYNQGPPEGLRGWQRRDWYKGRNSFFRRLQARQEATEFDLDKRYDQEIYTGATRWLEANTEEGAEPTPEQYRQAYEAGKEYQRERQEWRSDRADRRRDRRRERQEARKRETTRIRDQLKDSGADADEVDRLSDVEIRNRYIHGASTGGYRSPEQQEKDHQRLFKDGPGLTLNDIKAGKVGRGTAADPVRELGDLTIPEIANLADNLKDQGVDTTGKTSTELQKLALNQKGVDAPDLDRDGDVDQDDLRQLNRENPDLLEDLTKKREPVKPVDGPPPGYVGSGRPGDPVRKENALTIAEQSAAEDTLNRMVDEYQQLVEAGDLAGLRRLANSDEAKSMGIKAQGGGTETFADLVNREEERLSSEVSNAFSYLEERGGYETDSMTDAEALKIYQREVAGQGLGSVSRDQLDAAYRQAFRDGDLAALAALRDSGFGDNIFFPTEDGQLMSYTDWLGSETNRLAHFLRGGFEIDPDHDAQQIINAQNDWNRAVASLEARRLIDDETSDVEIERLLAAETRVDSIHLERQLQNTENYYAQELEKAGVNTDDMNRAEIFRRGSQLFTAQLDKSLRDIRDDDGNPTIDESFIATASIEDKLRVAGFQSQIDENKIRQQLLSRLPDDIDPTFAREGSVEDLARLVGQQNRVNRQRIDAQTPNLGLEVPGARPNLTGQPTADDYKEGFDSLEEVQEARRDRALAVAEGLREDRRTDRVELEEANQKAASQVSVDIPGSDIWGRDATTLTTDEPFRSEVFAEAISKANRDGDTDLHRELVRYYDYYHPDEPYLGKGGTASEAAWEQRGFLHRNPAIALPLGFVAPGAVIAGGTADVATGLIGGVGNVGLQSILPTGDNPWNVPDTGLPLIDVPAGFFDGIIQRGDEGWFELTPEDLQRAPGAFAEGYLTGSVAGKAGRVIKVAGNKLPARFNPFRSNIGSSAAGELGTEAAYVATPFGGSGWGYDRGDLQGIVLTTALSPVADLGVEGGVRAYRTGKALPLPGELGEHTLGGRPGTTRLDTKEIVDAAFQSFDNRALIKPVEDVKDLDFTPQPVPVKNAAVGLILRDADTDNPKLLLNQRGYGYRRGKWTGVGGLVDPITDSTGRVIGRESPETSFVREALEETGGGHGKPADQGAKVEVIGKMFDDTYSPTSYFIAEYKGGELSPQQGESLGLEWVPLKDIDPDDLAFFYDRQAVRHLTDRLQSDEPVNIDEWEFAFQKAEREFDETRPGGTVDYPKGPLGTDYGGQLRAMNVIREQGVDMNKVLKDMGTTFGRYGGIKHVRVGEESGIEIASDPALVNRLLLKQFSGTSTLLPLLESGEYRVAPGKTIDVESMPFFNPVGASPAYLTRRNPYTSRHPNTEGFMAVPLSLR